LAIFDRAWAGWTGGIGEGRGVFSAKIHALTDIPALPFPAALRVLGDAPRVRWVGGRRNICDADTSAFLVCSLPFYFSYIIE